MEHAPEFFAENVSNFRFVAWDTETTGASPALDHLVEIAALSFDEDFEHRRFELLVKPPIAIPAEVIKIHGITDDQVAHATSAGAALEKFFEFLAWSGGPRVLLAHNAGFDVGMVHGELRRMEAAAPVKRALAAATPELVLDTCMLAKNLLPDLTHHRLEALARHFKVETGRLHRAAADVNALHGVFMGLLGLAADVAAARGQGLTLGSLVDLAGGYFVLEPGGVAAREKSFRLPPRIASLEPLCGTESRVGISYEHESDARVITPVSIKMKGFRVYVEAFCHRDGVKKSFRADRILKIGRVEC